MQFIYYYLIDNNSKTNKIKNCVLFYKIYNI